jgi:hypothetical protein
MYSTHVDRYIRGDATPGACRRCRGGLPQLGGGMSSQFAGSMMLSATSGSQCFDRGLHGTSATPHLTHLCYGPKPWHSARQIWPNAVFLGPLAGLQRENVAMVLRPRGLSVWQWLHLWVDIVTEQHLFSTTPS